MQRADRLNVSDYPDTTLIRDYVSQIAVRFSLQVCTGELLNALKYQHAQYTLVKFGEEGVQLSPIFTMPATLDNTQCIVKTKTLRALLAALSVKQIRIDLRRGAHLVCLCFTSLSSSQANYAVLAALKPSAYINDITENEDAMKQEEKPVYQHAESEHIDEIKAIADANRAALGFINRAKIEQMVGENRIIVALLGGKVVGFVAFRHRKTDTQTTLSEICLDQSVRGLGYGRGLIAALYQECLLYHRTHILLKCTADSNANLFYNHLGFRRIATEAGKIRELHVWEMRVRRENCD